MCGIFGFVGEKPDMKRLEEIANGAARRGPDACGLAWYGPEDDQQGCVRKTGSFEFSLELLQEASDARIILGHSRLATVGEPTDISSAQPLQTPRVTLVHNGNVYNWKELAETFQLSARTRSDSEILALMIGYPWTEPGWFDLPMRVQRALGRISPAPFALCVMMGRELVAACSGLPLYGAEETEGLYLCSTEFAGATRFKDHSLICAELGELQVYSDVPYHYSITPLPGSPAPKRSW